MVEGAGPGGPENGPGSKPATTVETAGGRLRFRVDLTPGETTIVSWKKLLREANLSEPDRPGPSSSSPSLLVHGGIVAEPPPPPAVVSYMKETAENEPMETQAQDGPNRLSNVIERIERMYAGSSDEEDLVLDNMPDDDEYDTDDSFIDDTELDDYFQVDNSAIKHDGFFVNRGKLERIEPSISMDQQTKKRRQKDLSKGGGSDDGPNPPKIMKMGNKGKKTLSSVPRSSTSQVNKEVIPNMDMLLLDSPANPTEISTKKKADNRVAADPSGLLNGDAISQNKYKDQQKPGVSPSEKHSSKLKESELQHTSAQSSSDKVPHKESLMQRKEGSTAKSKSTDLEKAFRELENIVAQFRPPSTEPQDPANQNQTVKKRLPPDIKLKLAKVARIAVSCSGQIPKDVINRLMSILGHLMQIRTLKRNLRAMTNMGLSAKQEKDDQIQKMKLEVAEMVKSRILRMKSKLEQQDANSDDFQETGPEEREALKRKYSLDDVLENKICELYDLYVERPEEDSGPPVRRLYEELASLWPSGLMHADRIKRAIYRAKNRKVVCSFRKDREKMKKKTVLALQAQNASNGPQAMNSHEKLLSHDRTSKLVISPDTGAARVPVASANIAKAESSKQEKMKKLASSSNTDLTEANVSSLRPKKKVKRKPNEEVVEAKLRLEKLAI